MARSIYGLTNAVIKTLFAGLMLCLPAQYLFADEISPVPYKKHRLQFMSENDKWSLIHTDRYYTNGIRFGYISPEYDFQKEKNIMNWGGKVAIALADKPHVTSFNLSISQEMFTPNLHIPVIADDHPYAGYLYFNMGVIQRSADMQERIFLKLGIVGRESLAELCQDITHDIINVDKFSGWKDQINTEPIINIQYQITKKYPLFNSKYVDIDILGSFEAALGNADTHIGAGGIFRIGYNLESDFGPAKINHMGDGSPAYNDDPYFYIFAGTSARIVIRNMFVQGNTVGGKKFNYTLNFLRFESALGLIAGYKGCRLGYSFNALSRDYMEQYSSHTFGTLFLDIAF